MNGIFGKWHLGHQDKYLPLQNGFDEYSGLICSNDMWPVGYDGKPIQSTKKSYYPTMSFWEGNSPSFDIKDFEDQSKLTTKSFGVRPEHRFLERVGLFFVFRLDAKICHSSIQVLLGCIFDIH